MLIRSFRICTPLIAAVAVLLLPARTGAGDQAVMITLADSALPSDVGANGSMVVGSFRNGGGFYWMPTTGVVFVGGKTVSSVSRDGKTIVGTAFDQRVSQAAIWLGRRRVGVEFVCHCAGVPMGRIDRHGRSGIDRCRSIEPRERRLGRWAGCGRLAGTR